MTGVRGSRQAGQPMARPTAGQRSPGSAAGRRSVPVAAGPHRPSAGPAAEWPAVGSQRRGSASRGSDSGSAAPAVVVPCRRSPASGGVVAGRRAFRCSGPLSLPEARHSSGLPYNRFAACCQVDGVPGDLRPVASPEPAIWRRVTGPTVAVSPETPRRQDARIGPGTAGVIHSPARCGLETAKSPVAGPTSR